MIKTKSYSGLFILFSFFVFSSMCHSALIDRGNGMIYDDVLDVTWLQDANHIVTSGASTTGLVTYSDASTWVDSLVFGGFDDWRLPTILPNNGSSYDIAFTFDGSSDRGFNNVGLNNELAHLFSTSLSNVSFFSTNGNGNQFGSGTFNSSFIDGESGLTVSFVNIGLSYWAYPANDPITNAAWAYSFMTANGTATGETQLLNTSANISVWAVRDGDIPSTPTVTPPTSVPEPDGMALILLSFVGSLVARKFTRAH